MLNLNNIDPSWTLFLDRDGVLNHEKNEDYIRNWNEFVFYPNVIAAIPLLNQCFEHLVIVTNQKGVGKGLMTASHLNEIHQNMLSAIESDGGKIHRIYFCSDLADDSPNRKPQPGMAFQAKKDFPQIDLKKSIMVGNRMSDMKFGRNAGMHTVFLATTHPEVPFPDPMIDCRFTDLYSFAEACYSLRKR
jgi:D-glycero-D-manno-heptose 1,7-bisphosphate phosphatase/D-glycero-alpha-D-manno-heptose 1-phosphate guanylyltransferase